MQAHAQKLIVCRCALHRQLIWPAVKPATDEAGKFRPWGRLEHFATSHGARDTHTHTHLASLQASAPPVVVQITSNHCPCLQPG